MAAPTSVPLAFHFPPCSLELSGSSAASSGPGRPLIVPLQRGCRVDADRPNSSKPM